MMSNDYTIVHGYETQSLSRRRKGDLEVKNPRNRDIHIIKVGN